MIALEFAPVQTTGAFRSIDFVRYLPQFGIAPHVISIEPDAAAQIFSARRNDSLLATLPTSVSIDRLSPERLASKTVLGRFIRVYTRFHDTFFGRFRHSLDRVLESYEAGRFKAVYVSAPPFGATRLGAQAAQRLGLPLIIDMRDAWAEWTSGPRPTILHQWAIERDEARVFEAATAIVTVTERLADLFRRSHPTIPPSRFHVVGNGFDGRPFTDVELGRGREKPTFDIAYVGSFYYSPRKSSSIWRPQRYLQYHHDKEDWSYRSPLYFLRAWRELFLSNPGLADRIRFHHFGSAPDWLAPMIAEHGFSAQSILHGMLPKQELEPALAQMDAQLATSMKRPDGGDYCLASKTFDYLTAGKPILGFVTDGSQRDFLIASGGAVICDPDDPSGSAARMASLMAGTTTLRLRPDFINQFHRQRQAERMAAIMRQVVGAPAEHLRRPREDLAAAISSHTPVAP